MKRIISIVLALSLMMTMLCGISIDVFANGEAESISLNETITGTVAPDETLEYYYTANVSDKMLVKAVSPSDRLDISIMEYAVDEDGEYYTSCDDYSLRVCAENEEYYHIFKANKNAQKPYRIVIRNFDDSAEVSFTLHLEVFPYTAVDFSGDTSGALYENFNGYWTTDSDGNDYYQYNTPDTLYKAGNKITVTKKDGTKEVYTYDDDANDYVDANGNRTVTYFSNDQYEHHWSVGSNNYVEITLFDLTKRIPITIVKNPVKSIRFVPKTPVSIIENTDGFWDSDMDGEDYFNYDTYSHVYSNGNKLIVTDNNNKETTYTYNGDEFVNSSGTALNDSYFNYSADVRSWKKNADNVITVSYFGKTATIPVTITENPIESVEFIPAKPINLVENTNGYWQTYDDGETEDYFIYNYSLYSPGNQLIVTNKDHSQTIFECKNINNNLDFYDGNNQRIDGQYFDDYSNQYKKHWTLGSDNFITVSYCGVDTKVPVTISENPIASIEFLPASPLTYYQNTNGYICKDENGQIYYRYNIDIYSTGNKLIVHNKDNSQTVYEYKSSDDSYGFYDENNQPMDETEFSFDDDQYDNHWTVGTHNITLGYNGITIEVPVTILPPLYQKIDIKLAEPIVLEEYDESWGDWSTDQNDKQFFDYYCIPSISNPDNQIIITDQSGKATVYTYRTLNDSEEDESCEYAFYDSQNNMLDEDLINYISYQEYEHWTVGNNYYTVNICGTETKVPVTINHVYKNYVTKATTTANGLIVTKCAKCGKISKKTVIPAPKTFKLSTYTYVFDNKAKKPGVTVLDNTGKKIAASNYTLTYKNNVKLGIGSVTVKFKGNYSGTKTLNFTIGPKGTALSSVKGAKKQLKLKWKAQKSNTTGYQIQISMDKSFKKGVKTVTVSKPKTVSTTVKKLTSKKTYFVRIRTYKKVGKTNVYSAWSAVKAAKVK